MSAPMRDDKHPFLMKVKNGAGHARTIELVARGRKVVISNPADEWKITLTPDEANMLSAAIGSVREHPFRMDVKDGLDRQRPIEIGPRDGEMVISSPANFWSIRLASSQKDTLAAAIQGASERARRQASS